MAGHRLAVIAVVFFAAGFAAHGNRIARAVGDADITAAPWLVQLVFMSQSDPSKVLSVPCSGVIVEEDLIVTTTHCFTNGFPHVWEEPEKYLQVLVGSTQKYSGGEPDGQLYKTRWLDTSYWYRWERNGTVHFYEYLDIAVLTLQEPIQFSEKVKAIPIAKNRPVAGTALIGGGWSLSPVGVQETGQDSQSSLYVDNVTVMSDSDCRNFMSSLGASKESMGSMLCAQTVDGNMHQGDFPSALWAQGPDGPQLVALLQSGGTSNVQSSGLYVDLNDEGPHGFMRLSGVKFDDDVDV